MPSIMTTTFTEIRNMSKLDSSIIADVEEYEADIRESDSEEETP